LKIFASLVAEITRICPICTLSGLKETYLWRHTCKYLEVGFEIARLAG